MSSHGAGERPHVAVIAFPFGSHTSTLLRFAGALAAASPGADFSFLSFSKPLAAPPPGETFSFLSAAKPLAALPRPATANLRHHAIPDASGEAAPAGDKAAAVLQFFAAAPGMLRGAVAAAEAEAGSAVSCVVSDAFLSVAADVAAEAGVPWVPVRTGSPFALAANLNTDLLRRTLGVGDQALARADDFLRSIPGLSSFRVRDLPEGVVFGEIGSGFPLLVDSMTKQLPRAAAVALSTFPGLDPALDAELAAKLPNPLPIGPFHLLTPPSAESEPADPHGCLAWLDRRGPSTVAYVCFGTIVSLHPAEAAELASGLEASGVPFLWSLKEKDQEHLPPGFSDRTKERGLVVSWAPQKEVLASAAVGVLVTHGGWQSVMEGVGSGLPMVCRPFFGDQRMNARLVSHVWKIGLGFEGGAVTKEELVRALESVLRGDEGKEMRERVDELRGTMLRAIAPGGSARENFDKLVELVSRR